LEVVEGAAPEASAPRPASGEPQSSRRSFRLLVALLLLAALALVVQTRRVGQLEGRVEGLGSDLASARQEIEAYQGQIGQVRGLVDDLGTRLEELRGLLGQDPVAAEAPEEAL
jgi:hypothetical protein